MPAGNGFVPEKLDWTADEDDQQETGQPPQDYDDSNDVQKDVEAPGGEDPAIEEQH